MATSISIGVTPPYSVHIGAGLRHELGAYLAALCAPCRCVLVCDSRVAPLYQDDVRHSLTAAGFAVFPFVFPAGEEQKNWQTLGELLEFMAEKQLTRSDCVIALGGGVCGDMGGFAAGCFMRGIQYIQVPTTLLAAVDSSVGGKTAIDLSGGKNLAGLFLQPAMVLCDTDCLQTLPAEQLASGRAEAIKSGILDGETLFSLACTPERDWEALIAGCVRFKGRIVALDEKEQNLRRILNLGHSAGHALERLSQYELPHGHAVSVGLAIITRCAVKRGLCPADDGARILAALQEAKLPICCEFSAAALAGAALADKKRRGNSITLVFPTGIGGCRLQPVAVSELETLFSEGMDD